MPDDNLLKMPPPGEPPDLSNSVVIRIGNKAYRISVNVTEEGARKAEVIDWPEQPKPDVP